MNRIARAATLVVIALAGCGDEKAAPAGSAGGSKEGAGATIKVLKGPFHAMVEKHSFHMEIWVGGEPYTSGASYVTSRRPLSARDSVSSSAYSSSPPIGRPRASRVTSIAPPRCPTSWAR